MIDMLYSIEDVLNAYNVKTYKDVSGDLIAIHKKIKEEWYWLYFRNYGIQYVQTGSTRKLEK